MKSIFLIALLAFVTFNVFAQTADTNKLIVTNSSQTTHYLLPDGKIITADKLDSVITSWNHQPFAMKHDETKPGLVELMPMNDTIRKQFADAKETAGTMLNQPAPDFELTDIYGQTHRLSELRGKVVVLNFWFTSCAPCRAEMPILNNIKAGADPLKVIFLGLALDSKQAILEFLHTQEFTYDLLTNSKGVHAVYKVSSCPTSMVIDKDGMIRFIQSSADNIGDTLPAAIQAVL